MQSTRCNRRIFRPPKVALAAVALLLGVGLATEARADDAYRVFRYERAAPPDYLRLSLEELAILGAGSIEYSRNRSNEGDWDLSFSGDSFRDKVAGRAFAFDANRFGTNWITHPLSGWLYYGAARANRVDATTALFVATLASGAWELVGEYREQVSINDLIVTPLGGAAVSETMLGLASWFERGRPTLGRSIVATGLAPIKRVHDALDEAVPLRAPDVPRGDLDARFFVGVGPTWQGRSDSVGHDLAMGLETHLFRGPSPFEPGHERRWLDDANVSTLRLAATLAGFAQPETYARGGEPFVDARLEARVAFAGYFHKDVDATSRGPRGTSIYFGAGTAFGYHSHVYDRATKSAKDEVATVDLLGTQLVTWHAIGPVRLHTHLGLALEFGGVTSLAMPERRRLRGTDGLPTVLADHDYTHALGGGLVNAVHLSTPLGRLEADARLDAFRSLVERDRYFVRYDPNVVAVDERLELSAAVARPLGGSVDLGLRATRLFRRSRIEEATKAFGETALRVELVIGL